MADKQIIDPVDTGPAALWLLQKLMNGLITNRIIDRNALNAITDEAIQQLAAAPNSVGAANALRVLFQRP